MPNNLENAASRAMGAAKDLKAVVKGLSGVFRHLMEEHGKVSALIRRVLSTSDDGVRAKLYPTIRSELLNHEKGELAAVYPVLAQYPELSEIAEDHRLNADDLEATILELDAISIGTPSWAPTFKRLAQLVEAHVEREESDYFPKAQKVLGDGRAEELLRTYQTAKHS